VLRPRRIAEGGGEAAAKFQDARREGAARDRGDEFLGAIARGFDLRPRAPRQGAFSRE
jgi:hypothetical protein